ATPEQLGRSGHFARLRLLDPVRYADLAQFQHETDDYVRLSSIVRKLGDNEPLALAERAHLAERLHNDPPLRRAVEQLDALDTGAVAVVLDALIDRHGTGRVMFRNRRATVGGFPRRMPAFAQLDGGLDDAQRQRMLAEFVADAQPHPAGLEFDYAN